MPVDQSGSHYFAARATDAAFVRSQISPKAEPEHEKFLFYRGIGHFNVPLQVYSRSDRELTVTNGSPERLTHLFALSVHDGKGVLAQLDRLDAGEVRTVELSSEPVPLAQLKVQIRHSMADALVNEGLYPREARAMVNTWEDSWFAEDGVRVLYVLPRSWTDARLPLTLTPTPRELVRVMVGRSEVLTPSLETKLLNTLNAAQGGNEAARQEAMAQLKHLGRFADPALRLTRIHGSTKAAELGYQLLSDPKRLASSF
jgi:hypothetical protein